MHASCHSYRVARSATEDAVVEGRRLAGHLSRLPGFVWFLLLDAGDGVLVAVSVFETAADQERADGEAAAWLAAQHGEPAPLPSGTAPALPSGTAPPLSLPLVTPVDACYGEVLVQRGL